MRVCMMVWLLLLTFYGCNLFKNTKASSDKSHQLSSDESNLQWSEQHDKLSNSSHLVFLKDTLNHNYTVQIWPKGTFSFSPEEGFSGEAGQILVSGNISENKTVASSTISKQRDQHKATGNLNKKNTEITDHSSQVKTSAPSWKWVLTGLVLLLAGVGYLYRKLTGKFIL